MSNWKEAGSRLRLHPHLGGKLAARVAARLLARPIPQEYDAFAVEELARNPSEFGKLAARYNLVEIAEACRMEADVGIMDGISNC